MLSSAILSYKKITAVPDPQDKTELTINPSLILVFGNQGGNKVINAI